MEAPQKLDLPNGRWYLQNIDGKDVYKPSVTTVLGVLDKGMDKWYKTYGFECDRIGQIAMDRGTRVHENIDAMVQGVTLKRVMTNGEWNIPDDEWKMLMGWKQWYIDVQPNILYHEYNMWVDSEGFAGTGDCICLIKDAKGNEKFHIIDYKTGKHYPDHQLQLTGYGLLGKGEFDNMLKTFHQEYPLISVLRVYEWRDTVKYDWKKYKYDEDSFRQIVSLWKKRHGSTPSLPAVLPMEISIMKGKQNADKG